MKETPQENIESLLDDWADGLLSQQQVNELRSLLHNNADARRQYVQWQMLSAALTMESGSLPIDDVETTLSVPAKHFPWTTLLTIAATVCFAVIATRWAYLEVQPEPIAAAAPNDKAVNERTGEPTSQGIALVTRLVDAQWENDQSAIAVGRALTPGRIKLQSGYAQIEFFCGASVVLEGPAEMELVSSTAAKFLQGRLRAQVPPAARGFQIDVDGMKVVDLGTEFGLSVSQQGSDVQVFDGEVELHWADTPTKLVKAGEAFSHESGRLSEITVTPDQFVDLAGLADHAKDQRNARYLRWQTFSQRLRQDERLIAYYAPDQADRWQRKLQNSTIPKNAEFDGAIVGARRVSGRWPDRGALEFKQPGDRVRVNIPGQFRSLTLACWVKIDSLDRWYNSLFLTDNYQRGEPHWQILDTGRMHFSVRVSDDPKGPEHKEVLSPPFWNPSMSGQWLHLAATYDVDAKKTTLYLNGKQLHQETIPDFQLVEETRIGMASIGNWSVPTKPDAHFAIRNLNGSIDEFAIFSAALSADEIAEIYENGKP